MLRILRTGSVSESRGGDRASVVGDVSTSCWCPSDVAFCSFRIPPYEADSVGGPSELYSLVIERFTGDLYVLFVLVVE